MKLSSCSWIIFANFWTILVFDLYSPALNIHYACKALSSFWNCTSMLSRCILNVACIFWSASYSACFSSFWCLSTMHLIFSFSSVMSRSLLFSCMVIFRPTLVFLMSSHSRKSRFKSFWFRKKSKPPSSSLSRRGLWYILSLILI